MDWSWCDAVWICTTDKNVKLDRFQETLNVLHDLGVADSKIHVNVEKHGKYASQHHSCAANHLAVWRKAHDAKHRKVFIVEDDIALAPNLQVAQVDKALHSFLHSPEPWHIIYLGCFAHLLRPRRGRSKCTSGSCVSSTPYEVREAACWAAHAYVVNDVFLRSFCNMTLQDIEVQSRRMLSTSAARLDDKISQYLSPVLQIDGWLVLMSRHGGLNAFAMHPHVVTQRSRPFTRIYSWTLEPMIGAIGPAWVCIVLLFAALLFVLVFVGAFGIALWASYQ